MARPTPSRRNYDLEREIVALSKDTLRNPEHANRLQALMYGERQRLAAKDFQAMWHSFGWSEQARTLFESMFVECKKFLEEAASRTPPPQLDTPRPPPLPPRRAVHGATFADFANSSALDERGGRFAALNDTERPTGVPTYPRLPATSVHALPDPGGDLPALGYSVDDPEGLKERSGSGRPLSEPDGAAGEADLLGIIDELQSEIAAQRTEIHDLRLELEAATPDTTPRTVETPPHEEEVVASASSSFSETTPPAGTTPEPEKT
jgi:hypothetical protein